MMGVKVNITTQNNWNQLGSMNHYTELKLKSKEIAKEYINLLKDIKTEDKYILVSLELPSGNITDPIWIKKEELEEELNG